MCIENKKILTFIVNENNKFLLLKGSENDPQFQKSFWYVVTGSCEKYDKNMIDTVKREVKEETNLDVNENDLEIVDIVSGAGRRNEYPNGDVVINNTALYCIKNYSGELKWDVESKEMRFFDLDNLPQNQNDPDLIEVYRRTISKSRK